MMLIMQTHVVCKEVQRSIIAEGLGDLHACLGVFGGCGLFLEDVVLGDEMPCAGVQRACKEG